MTDLIDRPAAAPTREPTVCTVRAVAISRDEAWDAWTTPGGLRSWWWTHDEDFTCTIDPHVGAGCRIYSAGRGLGARGRFVTVDRPRRLVLRWRWLDEHGPAPEGLVTVTFAVNEEDGDETVVRVEHTLSDGAATGPCAERWNQLMDSFAELGSDGQQMVCPRCGWPVQGDPPVCTSHTCPLTGRDGWYPDQTPVPLVDY
ncbi:SRPBCC domain-containing protein [Ruania suaedae]|uniref:SRPBCC family protein n=1 Tax=Ruania suaedae TaxID=2897774 RepID=UPI001E32B9C7|nr:SRPBCC family protein [Ruania suaedae]UFU02237.1 SRPBCC domain-containing protein [Ruania suaedae]